MRKLILLGMFALPLLGAGFAQAAEPVYTPVADGCTATLSAIQCQGTVTNSYLVDFINATIGFDGLNELLGSSGS